MRVLQILFLCVVLFAVAFADHRDVDDVTEEDIKKAKAKYGKGTARQRLLDCNQVKREVEFEVDSYKIKLKVDADKEARKEKKGYKCDADLDVLLDTNGDDGLKAKLSLKAVNGDAKIRFGFDFRAFEIVEFVDKGKKGLDGNDTIVQTYTIGSGMNVGDKKPDKDAAGADRWAENDKIKNNSIIPDPENEGCYSYSVHTVKKIFAAVARYCKVPQVTFTKDAGREYVDKYNVTRNLTLSYKLSPNAVKFDFLINEFPFMYRNTKLAILGKLKTKTKFKVRRIGKVVDDKGKDELDVDGSGGFSWATTAFADGQTIPVLITSGKDDNIVGDDSEHSYAWTFDREGAIKHLIWDPEVVGDMGGIASTSSAASAYPTLLFAVVSLVAVFFNQA